MPMDLVACAAGYREKMPLEMPRLWAIIEKLAVAVVCV